jgi:hypothetical protein
MQQTRPLLTHMAKMVNTKLSRSVYNELSDVSIPLGRAYEQGETPSYWREASPPPRSCRIVSAELAVVQDRNTQKHSHYVTGGSLDALNRGGLPHRDQRCLLLHVAGLPA